jgi:hypothetical protein
MDDGLLGEGKSMMLGALPALVVVRWMQLMSGRREQIVDSALKVWYRPRRDVLDRLKR